MRATRERSAGSGSGYAFVQPEGSAYPPILEMNLIEGPVRITGDGGPVTLRPFLVNHGRIDALGFRVGNLAYLPDAAAIYEESWQALAGLDCWVVDALRRTPHPTHAHLDRTLEWIARARPRRAVLTNMHVDLDYATLEAETPPHVTPAFDGDDADLRHLTGERAPAGRAARLPGDRVRLSCGLARGSSPTPRWTG